MTNGNDRLVFATEDAEHEIELDDRYAPETTAALLESLPMEIDIHCAKIAGSHIFWHAPFLARIEEGADIHAMPPGSFVYFPERQFLELIYAELQAETASVNVLGRLAGDLDWLTDLAERNRRKQGRELFTARLYRRGGDTEPRPLSPPDSGDAWSRLRAARMEAWAREPGDVQRLLARRGLMIPFGPLHMAEGEMRKLHEWLWRLWDDRSRYGDEQKVTLAVFLIEAALTRVAGFCHMTEVGEALEAGIACLREGQVPVADVLEELVLYCGRVAAWLDQHICWWPINEITLDALAKKQAV